MSFSKIKFKKEIFSISFCNSVYSDEHLNKLSEFLKTQYDSLRIMRFQFWMVGDNTLYETILNDLKNSNLILEDLSKICFFPFSEVNTSKIDEETKEWVLKNGGELFSEGD